MAGLFKNKYCTVENPRTLKNPMSLPVPIMAFVNNYVYLIKNSRIWTCFDGVILYNEYFNMKSSSWPFVWIIYMMTITAIIENLRKKFLKINLD